MSKPKKRRRIVLPALLATGLTAAAGVGGYVLYAPSLTELSEAAQEDLNAGFESAQGNDTLDSLASAWKRDTLDDSTAEQLDVAQVSTQEHIDAAPIEPLPEVATDDRYAAALLDGPQSGAPDNQVIGTVPEPTDRYGNESVPVDEPHAAGELVARGQTPMGDLPPIEALPEANPLRGSSSTIDQTASLPSTASAAQAFDSAAPLPNTAPDNYRAAVGPEPTLAASNPLRSPPPQQPTQQQDFHVAEPEAAQFADARPIAVNEENQPFDHQSNSLDSQEFGAATAQPIRDLARENTEAADAFAQPPANSYSPRELRPTERSPRSAAFEPTPMAEDSMGSPAIDEGTGRPGERALEGPQRPALVLQKFAPEEIQVGKECKFVIKVRNVGQRPADNVSVEDEVPQGTRFVSASPQPESAGGTLEWPLGTLSPGEERTLEVVLMPTEEGEIGSVAQVTFASHASAKSRCTRPQLALRMTAPSEVLIGRQQRLTIELHNPGTGDATGVMLLENVPENVRHQSGPALEFEVGTLRAGETRRMELVLTAEKAGRVTNVVTARADGNLQVQQEVEFEVISPALSVEVNGPSQRYLERPATYTVSVDNPGTAPAKDVQLVTKLPKGMRFVRANNLGEYDSATHSVYWSLAELPKGENGTVELVALPVQSGDHTIEVEGRAREGLEDRTSREVRVEGLVAIMFEVADAQDPIEVGGSTSYEVRVVNQGSKAASNVRVTALVPPGMKVTGATGETRHAVEAEGVVFEPLPRLAPKADAVFRVDVQGVRPGDQRLVVEVRTDDITQPIRKEESTRVFGDE